MDRQQKIKGDLNIFRTRLGMLKNTAERQRAIEVTDDFYDAIAKRDVSDFVLYAKGRTFIKEITILRGVALHKIKLDAQSIALFEEIRNLIPASQNRINMLI
ncbi:hypothetical protein [Pediococcus inopinatus]|uniref:hypothetical protein n=1 Tax=Pediococcus TaxID=1253 RepID=UPI0007089B81|nr:hypothetical protein [Pediococcus inopinatus]AVL00948.1 hypothetical protein PI20285_09995 [Pediococcus inopinatus]WPC16739.1 hypothetical protein N6G94_05970 [Pediococcus inopinatus]